MSVILVSFNLRNLLELNMIIALILAMSAAATLNTPASQAAATKAVHVTGEYVALTEYTCGEGVVARQTTKHCEQ